MKIITISARHWESVPDFYRAILEEIKAPEWHGKNVNALIDSLVYGGINGIESPFRLDIVEMSALPRALKSAIIEEVSYVLQARDGCAPTSRPAFDILFHDQIQ